MASGHWPNDHQNRTDFTRHQFEFLYGTAEGTATATRLAALLEQYRMRIGIPADDASQPFSAANSLLITNADQIREPARAPLQTLADFAAQRLLGVVSGIHLLPFYPSSSDDGFSVKDFFAVDPAWGTWDDWRQPLWQAGQSLVGGQ